ncbi:hypothetical protein ACPPVS_08905 [Cellulomonas sp. McL0617]|uniref:hypothetical protein n=1 Tax=Cellulomonas sp. McL0617 TaxID=3415675 RepID=UPI003CE8E7AA
MRAPLTTARMALHERLVAPAQESTLEPEGDLPPYLESFLAHVRLLVGVPFEYLVPDERLLPPESIRFFYVDRSWTDRLVDGAIAVGQIGSREEAHYQARATSLGQLLDQSERMVRPMQRGMEFPDAKKLSDADHDQGTLVTGFVLRSSAVKGWPHMDVRAYDAPVKEPYKSADPTVVSHQLKLLRLELLAPSVMIALFEGEPQMVILEEPHHGIQFGVRHLGSSLAVPLRTPTGEQVRVGDDAVPVPVPVRSRHADIVRVAALQTALQTAQAAHPTAIQQTGAGAFAISVLDPPWRQHFEGTVDHADTGAVDPDSRFPAFHVTAVLQQGIVLSTVKTVLGVV